MLVTSTLIFVCLAVQSGVDLVRLVVGRGAVTPAQRVAMQQRYRFLLGLAFVLVVIYAIYLTRA